LGNHVSQIKSHTNNLESKFKSRGKGSNRKIVPGIEKKYGVYNPLLNELAKQFKDGGFELAEEL
jgi:hypothetical protein